MKQRKSGFIIFLFCLFAFSCLEPEINDGERIGDFSLSLSADSSVVNITTTKSAVSIVNTDTFKVQIVNRIGSVLKEWPAFSEMPDPVRFAEGYYIIKAYCGDSTVQGFDRPAFSGSTPVQVLYNENKHIDVVCKFANTLVSVVVSEGFKNYYSDYNVEVSTTGEPLIYEKEETRIGYLEPGNITATVNVTRSDGKILAATFPPVAGISAGDHYRLNVDVNDGAGAVSFELIEEATNDIIQSIVVPVSAASGEAPYFIPTGFQLDQPVVTVSEATTQSTKVLLKARAKIKTCNVKIRSSYLISKGVPAEFDLANTSTNIELSNILKSIGLKWSDNMKGTTMGEIDFTDVIKLLPAGPKTSLEHVFTLSTTDYLDRTTTPLPLKTIVMPPTIEITGFSRVAEVNNKIEIDMLVAIENGTLEHLSNVFYQKGWEWVKLSSFTKELSEDKKSATIKLTDIEIGQTEFPIRIEHTTPEPFNTKRNSDDKIAFLNAPTFTMDYFSDSDNSAVITVTASEEIDPRLLRLDLRNQGFWENVGQLTGYDQNAKISTFTFSGLTPSERYRVRAVYNNRYTSVDEAIFSTKGFSFDDRWTSSTINDVPKGGYWGKKSIFGKVSWSKFPSVGIIIDSPNNGWATSNEKTVPTNPATKNTWYMVPSITKVEGVNAGAGVKISSVGWNNAGNAIPNASGGGTGAFDSWETSASDVQAPIFANTKYNRSAGKLFLGTYNCIHNGGAFTEAEATGIPLRSRPLGLKGQYKYVPEGVDKAQVAVVLEHRDENGNATEVGRGVFTESNTVSNWIEFNISIRYINQLKVTHLRIECVSSTADDGNVPLKVDDKQNCVAIGSQLYVDEIELVY